MAEKQSKNELNSPPSGQHEVRFEYIKSNFFRVIHADGAWGGISPRGNIHISFYNERAAIPDSSKLVVSDEGLVKPEEFQATSQLVREVEVDVIVDLQTAIVLSAWLNNKITILQEMVRNAQEMTDDVEKTPNTQG